MRFFHLKRPRSLQNRSRQYPIYGAVGLILALCIALGVMTFLKVREDRQVNFAHAQITSGIQSELTMVLRTYDQMSLPRADIAGDLLPTMGKHLYSAYALNTVLTDVYGKSQSILGNEFYNQITSAIDEIDSDISMGKIVDVKQSALSGCMVQMQGVLAARFGSDGLLLPQTAMN